MERSGRPQALQGMRVLELAESLPAAWCGRQFALWGAEVTVVEADAGSPIRRKGPWAEGLGGRFSLLWEHVAAGKRSRRLGGAALTELARSADVMLVDRDLGWLAELGVSAASLAGEAPDAVVVELSPFGAGGPFSGYAASELVAQALGGYLHLNGAAGGAPLKAPGHIIAYASGVSAFVAALAGLIGRERGRGGALIESAALEAVASMVPTLRGQYTRVYPKRSGGPGTGVALVPCADGFVSFMPPTTRQLGEFGRALGIAPEAWPACAHDARAAGRAAELMAFLAAHTRALPAEQVLLAILREGVACGMARRPDELLAEPQLAARGFFHAVEGGLTLPGAPARLSKTPAAGFAPAPKLGEADAAPPLTRSAAPPPSRPLPLRGRGLPLEGVFLIDLTQAWIGPYAAWLLTELGAEAVKIESHKRPDVWRQWSHHPVAVAQVDADLINTSPNYNSVNMNKRSLCLDLKTEAGRDILLRLADAADLVMENYTPRVMERLGLDHARLRQGRPRLVTSSFSGYGKTGPLSDYKANGTTIEAMAGWDHFHRYPSGEPMVMGFYQADAICGLQMAATTLVALLDATRTGEGQSVDGAMYETAAGYLGEAILEAEVGGRQTPFGNRDLDFAPNAVFACAGDDAWLALSIETDEAWRRLVEIAPELADEAFATAEARLARQDELEERIEAWTRGHAADALETRLQRAGIAAARVCDAAELLGCPHLSARGWWRRLSHADVGEHLHAGAPWRFAGAAPALARPRRGSASTAARSSKTASPSPTPTSTGWRPRA